MCYTYDIVQTPGKHLHTADALSRSPLIQLSPDNDFTEELELFIEEVVNTLLLKNKSVEKVRVHQQEDEVCRNILMYCREGWPERHLCPGSIRIYWQHQPNFTEKNILLLYNGRLLIPSSLRLKILDELHAGHQGINKTRMRANQSVWWPCMSREIADLVQNCRTCAHDERNKKEPLIATPTPELPWQKVASDLFEWNKQQYLLVIDYRSRFIEVECLSSTTSSEVIIQMKKMFARHGIPQCMITDNGPQYSSSEFAYKLGHGTHNQQPRSLLGKWLCRESGEDSEGLV